MNDARSALAVVAWGFACAMAGSACGKQTEAAPPGGTSAPTPVAVSSPAPDQEATSEPVCLGESEGQVLGSEAPAASPHAVKAKIRDVPTKERARAANTQARLTKEHLDAEIAQKVDEEQAHATPEPAAASAQVTTTSATVERAPTATSPAPARLAFENDLSSTYVLDRLRFLVDGAVAYDGRSPSASVVIPPGEHAVEMIADYHLHDPTFSYLRDYHTELRSGRVVPAGNVAVTYVAIAHPQGGVTTPIQRAAAIAWRSESER